MSTENPLIQTPSPCLLLPSPQTATCNFKEPAVELFRKHRTIGSTFNIRLDVLLVMLDYVQKPKPIEICRSVTLNPWLVITDLGNTNIHSERVLYDCDKQEVFYCTALWLELFELFNSDSDFCKLFIERNEAFVLTVPREKWFIKPEKAEKPPKEIIHPSKGVSCTILPPANNICYPVTGDGSEEDDIADAMQQLQEQSLMEWVDNFKT